MCISFYKYINRVADNPDVDKRADMAGRCDTAILVENYPLGFFVV